MEDSRKLKRIEQSQIQENSTVAIPRESSFIPTDNSFIRLSELPLVQNVKKLPVEDCPGDARKNGPDDF